ncbi:MAG: NAD(P)H-hydrate epimerase [bacterium]
MKVFYTKIGLPIPAVTREKMREIDRLAITELGPNLFQMMENAGRSLASLAMNFLGESWKNARIRVLAGTGGNGGGGICAARHLANRGLKVGLSITHPQRLNSVAEFQRQVFQATAGEEMAIENLHDEPADLILDAVIGYNLKGAAAGRAAETIQWANRQPAPILSLDVPSGLDATTAETPGVCINARWTLTLALPKTGLLPEKCGQLFLADIGIPATVYERAGLRITSPFDKQFIVPLQTSK